MARDRPTAQRSTYDVYDSSRASDGQSMTESCTTDEFESPWWAVKLPWRLRRMIVQVINTGNATNGNWSLTH